MSPVADLSGLAKKLNQATDEINKMLKEIEEHLFALNLGVEAEAPILVGREWATSSGTEQQYTKNFFEQYYVAWKKSNNKWMLMIVNKTFQQAYDINETDRVVSETWEPVLNTNRQLRATALSNIEDLFAALKTEGEKLLKAVEKGHETQETIYMDLPY
jgi:hypothetical protein